MSCLCNLFYKKKKESTLTRIIKGIPQTRSYKLINSTHTNGYEFTDEYEFAPLSNNNTLCCLFPHITTKIYKTQINPLLNRVHPYYPHSHINTFKNKTHHHIQLFYTF